MLTVNLIPIIYIMGGVFPPYDLLLKLRQRSVMHVQNLTFQGLLINKKLSWVLGRIYKFQKDVKKMFIFTFDPYIIMGQMLKHKFFNYKINYKKLFTIFDFFGTPTSRLT